MGWEVLTNRSIRLIFLPRGTSSQFLQIPIYFEVLRHQARFGVLVSLVGHGFRFRFGSVGPWFPSI